MMSVDRKGKDILYPVANTMTSALAVLPSLNSTVLGLMRLMLGRVTMLPRATWWTRVADTVGWLWVMRIQ
jgi:hypothetical protein